MSAKQTELLSQISGQLCCLIDSAGNQIEIDLANVGCVKDAEGQVTGKVFLCKEVSEETGAITWVTYLLSLAGGEPVPYAGPIETCDEDCEPLNNSGLVTDITNWN